MMMTTPPTKLLLSRRPISTAVTNAQGIVLPRPTVQQQQHYYNNDNSTFSTSWWMLASVVAAAAVGTIPATVVTRNDGAPRNETTQKDDDDNDDDEEEEAGEDPYDNLPDEDEPTHCSICNVYRQGPCRPYWRKAERCMKDHELPKQKESHDDDNDDDKNTTVEHVCFKYMAPWSECARGYRGLYALIEMDTNYALGIADLEEETTTSHQVLCWNPTSPEYPVQVDWTEWHDYIKKRLEEGNNEDGYHGWTGPTTMVASSSSSSSPLQSSSSSVNPKSTSLWKTLHISKPSDDPVLIPIEATIPRMEHDGIGVLECAYALDQQGNVLGFVYGSHSSPIKQKKPSKEEATNDKDTTTTTTTTEEEEEPPPGVPTTTLTIRLMPSHTSHITIGASYVRPGNNEQEEDMRDETTTSRNDVDQPTTTLSNNKKKKTTETDDKSYTRLYKTRPLSLLEQAQATQSTNH
jgi:hypothetical protein